MRWQDLDSIDWDQERSAEEWSSLLGELMKLAEGIGAGGVQNARRDKLAGIFDTFADASWAEDGMDDIRKLDASARRAAQALRLDATAAWLDELKAATGDYKDAAKHLAGATAKMKKEASRLRADKINVAIKSLNDVIDSMRDVAKELKDGPDDALASSIGDLVKKAQKLREVFEKS